MIIIGVPTNTEKWSANFRIITLWNLSVYHTAARETFTYTYI